MVDIAHISESQAHTLTLQIKAWGKQLGFQQVGICGIDLTTDEEHLHTWLSNKYNGSMAYMSAHGNKRARPAELWPGTIRVISVRLDYTNKDALDALDLLDKPEHAYVSRYAVGRDYHRVLRQRLSKLAQKIRRYGQLQQSDFSKNDQEPYSHRAFVDSAPVLEKALARDAGLGWIGKHTNLINKDAGSWFFLGELFTNLPLIKDKPVANHCGSCNACIEVCPTQAIVAPYQVDARRCISYLTIENKGPIPVEFRQAMGNRIYGCDDCQLFCPWNKFAQTPTEEEFKPRHNLDQARLIELFNWSAEDFDKNTQGSAIRRIGYFAWLRNVAIALGNAPSNRDIVTALKQKLKIESKLVREHVKWALEQHQGKSDNQR